MEKTLKILNYIIIIAGSAALIGFMLLLFYLSYSFKHPYICNYTYQTEEGEIGETQRCGEGTLGGKYCTIAATKHIRVVSYEYKCGRR